MYWIRKNIYNKKTLRKSLDFDTTPIADLSFNLLIFFIVTASFIIRQGIFLTLPSPSSGTVKVEQSKIIDIYPDNINFIINGKPYKRDDLLELLKVKKEQNPDTVVIIHMKNDIKYERLVDTLSIVREAKLKKISLQE